MRSDLSAIEIQVLRKIQDGATDREIARDLFLYESAVKAYVRSICGKLGVRSGSEAAAANVSRAREAEPAPATPKERGGRGGLGELRPVVQSLVDFIWEREQPGSRSIDAPLMRYLQEAVTTEITHRRRLRDLDRRLAALGR